MKQKETTLFEFESDEFISNVSFLTRDELVQALQDNNYSKEVLSQALCNVVSLMDYSKAVQLLKAGADPNYQNGSPLIILARGLDVRESQMCVEVLHEFGAEMNGSNGHNQGLTTAIKEGNRHVFEKMIELGGLNLTFRDSEALCVAAMEGKTEFVKKLIPLDSNQNFNEAYCFAAEYGHTDVLDVLYEHVNTNDLKHDALERASFFGEIDAVYHMIEKQGQSINTHDNSFIFTALESSNKEFVDYTISKIDKPLAVVQDAQIMSYIQLHKPELITSLNERMRETITQQTAAQHKSKTSEINQTLNR